MIVRLMRRILSEQRFAETVTFDRQMLRKFVVANQVWLLVEEVVLVRQFQDEMVWSRRASSLRGWSLLSLQPAGTLAQLTLLRQV